MPSWEQRNGGLTWSDTRFLITDPWTHVNNGSWNPEDTVVYAGGAGYLRRSPDGAKTWEELAPTLDDPSDPWGDLGGVLATDVTYLGCHGDPHHNGRFFAIVEYQSPISLAWRGWILSTDNHWLTHTWFPLVPLVIPGGGYIYASASNYTLGSRQNGGDRRVVLASGSAPAMTGAADGSYATFEVEAGLLASDSFRFLISFDMGTEVSGARTVEINSALLSPGMTVQNARMRGTNDPAIYAQVTPNAGMGAINGWTEVSLDNPEWLNVGGTFAWRTLTAWTIAEEPSFRYYLIDTECRTNWTVGAQYAVDAFRMSGTFADVQARPLSADLDSEDGSRLYLTVSTGSDLQLWSLDVSDPATPARLYTSSLGAATAGEVAAKTYFAFPFSPSLPGVASFGDIVYVAGRMAGAIGHVGRSTDTGASFSDISPAGLTVERIGAFHGDSDGTTLFAVVNGAAPALYRSLNTGGAWSSMVALPFGCEFEGLSKHPDGTILLASGAAASAPTPRAVTVAGPGYSSYSDFSGAAPNVLPDSTAGLPSIVWAV